MAVYIRSDRMYDSYTRQVNDLLTVLGTIGGLLETLKGIGYVFVGVFAQKLFMSKIVRKIYHIRRYENLEYEAAKAGETPSPDAMQRQLDIVKANEQNLQREFRKKEGINDSDMGNLFFAFLNRARFKYRISDILEYLFRCFFLRSLDDNRRTEPHKRHFLFQKAEEKFMQELDVVRIVRT